MSLDDRKESKHVAKIDLCQLKKWLYLLFIFVTKIITGCLV